MQSRFLRYIGILQLISVIQSPKFVDKTLKTTMGNSCGGSCSSWMKKAEHALEPTNHEVAEYCKSIICVSFQGETSNKVDEVTDHTEDKHAIHLGSVLQSMEVEIREKGDNFNGNETQFMEYLEMAIGYRTQDHVDKDKFRAKIMKDKEIFVEHLKTRKGSASELHHITYWGTRQQLRSGKVVGDWIDAKYGSIDPIFGVLLNPTGGRTGPGDSDVIHAAFFDEDGPIAYHSAVHDAFGYLLTSHDTGPGYKYLGAASLFNKDNPLSEQFAGIKFWKKALKHHKDTKCQSVRL